MYGFALGVSLSILFLVFFCLGLPRPPSPEVTTFASSPRRVTVTATLCQTIRCGAKDRSRIQQGDRNGDPRQAVCLLSFDKSDRNGSLLQDDWVRCRGRKKTTTRRSQRQSSPGSLVFLRQKRPQEQPSLRQWDAVPRAEEDYSGAVVLASHSPRERFQLWRARLYLIRRGIGGFFVILFCFLLFFGAGHIGVCMKDTPRSLNKFQFVYIPYHQLDIPPLDSPDLPDQHYHLINSPFHSPSTSPLTPSSPTQQQPPHEQHAPSRTNSSRPAS